MSAMNKYLQLTAAFSLLLTVSIGTKQDIEVNFPSRNTTDPPTEVAEADCTKSYKSLVTELLKNPTNYFNLQITFFPPDGTSPDFVIITYIYSENGTYNYSENDTYNYSESGTYNYSENGTSTTQISTVWFWSSAAYFFFYPIRIFQFTSFMFSDPQLHQITLTLHLPVDCVHVSDTFMKLLTQRLKLYAMHQKVNAPIDTSYQPKSHSVKTLIQWHTDNRNTSRLVLSAQIVFPVLATILMVLFFVYLIELEPRKFGQKLNNEIHSSTEYISASGKAKLLIILTISFLFNACALITDGFALKEYTTLAPEVNKYYNHTAIEFRCFYVIPFLMTVFDGLSLLFIIIPVAVAMKGYYRNKNNSKNNWSILVYTLLSPLSNIATHAYHIIIAFIDNPYHASSMLLSFTAVLFIHIVVFQKIYYYIFKWVNSQELSACCNPIKDNKSCWMLFLLGCYALGIITLSVVIGLAVSVLILLPIDNAIDDAPTNIYTVFQASVAVIAAIVTYQVFFRETSSIGEVFIRARDTIMVNDRNNKWNSMSEKQKEIELAKQFLKYISQPLSNQNHPPHHPPPQDDPPDHPPPQDDPPDHPPPPDAPSDHPPPPDAPPDHPSPPDAPPYHPPPPDASPDHPSPPDAPPHHPPPPDNPPHHPPPPDALPDHPPPPDAPPHHPLSGYGTFAAGVTSCIPPQGIDEDISRVDDKTCLLPKQNNAVEC